MPDLLIRQRSDRQAEYGQTMTCELCGKDGHDRSYHVPGIAGQSGDYAGKRRPTSAAITCPHCGHAGSVTKRTENRKVGVSGGKAAGAVLTAGFSILATGLSRRQRVTVLNCGRCGMKWSVAA